MRRALLLGVPDLGAARAEDAFYRVPLATIPEAEKALSEARRASDWRNIPASWHRSRPYAVLDREGEVYVTVHVAPGFSAPRPGAANAWPPDELVIRAPQGKEVTGRLVLPKPDWSGMTPVAFSIPASAAAGYVAFRLLAPFLVKL